MMLLGCQDCALLPTRKFRALRPLPVITYSIETPGLQLKSTRANTLPGCWTRISEDIFEQELSFIDRFFGAPKAKEGSICAFDVTISTDFTYYDPSTSSCKHSSPETLIREAWIALRNYLSVLTVWLSPSRTKEVYGALQRSEDVTTWADATPAVHEQETLAEVYEAIRKVPSLTPHYFTRQTNTTKHKVLFQAGYPGHRYPCIRAWGSRTGMCNIHTERLAARGPGGSPRETVYRDDGRETEKRKGVRGDEGAHRN
ncbi:hypothetical protein F5Y19DRAFT_471967 [Xylariaceae sp. FL1651]|nr:hypothetical protein F5Y19DRAFT_471967 [Xylariaceae sp. FL1651]